jgi:hypothetical protein
VITKVSEKGLLVDVGTVSLLKMPIRAIREVRTDYADSLQLYSVVL